MVFSASCSWTSSFADFHYPGVRRKPLFVNESQVSLIRDECCKQIDERVYYKAKITYWPYKGQFFSWANREHLSWPPSSVQISHHREIWGKLKLRSWLWCQRKAQITCIKRRRTFRIQENVFFTLDGGYLFIIVGHHFPSLDKNYLSIFWEFILFLPAEYSWIGFKLFPSLEWLLII